MTKVPFDRQKEANDVRAVSELDLPGQQDQGERNQPDVQHDVQDQVGPLVIRANRGRRSHGEWRRSAQRHNDGKEDEHARQDEENRVEIAARG